MCVNYARVRPFIKIRWGEEWTRLRCYFDSCQSSRRLRRRSCHCPHWCVCDSELSKFISYNWCIAPCLIYIHILVTLRLFVCVCVSCLRLSGRLDQQQQEFNRFAINRTRHFSARPGGNLFLLLLFFFLCLVWKHEITISWFEMNFFAGIKRAFRLALDFFDGEKQRWMALSALQSGILKMLYALDLRFPPGAPLAGNPKCANF